MTKAPKTTKPTAKPAAKPAATKTAAKPRARLAVAKAADVAKTAAQPLVAVVTPAPAAAKPASVKRDGAPVLHKKDFLERVLATSGAKKKDAQTVVEATLKVLGEALSKGESLALPPFGKARVSRQIDKNGSDMLVIKLRRGGVPKPGKGKKTADESLADSDD